MNEQIVKIGEGGRVIIPAACRRMLGVAPGDELVLKVHDGEIRLFQRDEALTRLRDLARRGKRRNGRIADFLAFRRGDSGD